MSTSYSDEKIVTGKKLDVPMKVVHLKGLKTVAMDRNNNFAWRTQFSAIMRGNDLYNYLTG